MQESIPELSSALDAASAVKASRALCEGELLSEAYLVRCADGWESYDPSVAGG